MQVFCGAIARISVRRQYVLIERSRARRTPLLQPISGILQASIAGRFYLEGLGALFEDSSTNLRFRIAEDRIPSVTTWFARPTERQATARPFVIAALQEVGLTVSTKLPGFRDKSVGQRQLRGEALHLVEVHDVTLPYQVEAALLEQAPPAVHLVSAENIAAGRLAGLGIHPFAKVMIAP